MNDLETLRNELAELKKGIDELRSVVGTLIQVATHHNESLSALTGIDLDTVVCKTDGEIH